MSKLVLLGFILVLLLAVLLGSGYFATQHVDASYLAARGRDPFPPVGLDEISSVVGEHLRGHDMHAGDRVALGYISHI